MIPSTSSEHRRRHLATRRLRRLAPSLLFLTAAPLYAQSTGTDPWDNAVNVLKTAFTGTIATGLSLVAIVVGGLMFAYGEGQSKKTIAGIVFGVGMATLLDAMNTGHRGTLATIHASSAHGALVRLRTLLLRGSSAIRASEADAEVRSSIHHIVHIERNGPARQVKEILEIGPS